MRASLTSPGPINLLMGDGEAEHDDLKTMGKNATLMSRGVLRRVICCDVLATWPTAALMIDWQTLEDCTGLRSISPLCYMMTTGFPVPGHALGLFSRAPVACCTGCGLKYLSA